MSALARRFERAKNNKRLNREIIMPTSDQSDTQVLEHVLEQWALAWSSSDVERLVSLFADSVDYEDVTFGAVNHGKNALRDFATGLFAAFADLKFNGASQINAWPAASISTQTNATLVPPILSGKWPKIRRPAMKVMLTRVKASQAWPHPCWAKNGHCVSTET